jgi:hypothetical protein
MGACGLVVPAVPTATSGFSPAVQGPGSRTVRWLHTLASVQPRSPRCHLGRMVGVTASSPISSASILDPSSGVAVCVRIDLVKHRICIATRDEFSFRDPWPADALRAQPGYHQDDWLRYTSADFISPTPTATVLAIPRAISTTMPTTTPMTVPTKISTPTQTTTAMTTSMSTTGFTSCSHSLPGQRYEYSPPKDSSHQASSPKNLCRVEITPASPGFISFPYPLDGTFASPEFERCFGKAQLKGPLPFPSLNHQHPDSSCRCPASPTSDHSDQCDRHDL